MLARALLDPKCYPHAVEKVELHETHISWVFVAGPYAYKVKKPVALGFLDFSTLEARRHYCEEELRLNRRFAPELYQDVVEIRGTCEAPCIGGTGALVDYALRMRRFGQGVLASQMLARCALTPKLMADFGRYLAGFHASLGPSVTQHGTTESVLRSTIENFDQISPLLEDPRDTERLAALRHWTDREFLERYGELRERHAAGFVRECHGDLHLGNIVAIEGRLVPFDCIEFSAALRWIDVMSEAAFLFMDLVDHGATALAWVFLNAYLDETGDYSGLAVLRFYLVYRAMVRAKIHLMRARQPGLSAGEQARLFHAHRGYIELAQHCAAPGHPALVLMHGLSGSGKSTVAAQLAPELGAIRIRSDIERKRLKGLRALASSASALESGLYDTAATDATYARLAHAARSVIEAGYTAIVDATFLKRSQRAALEKVARATGTPALAICVDAPREVLRRRIGLRSNDPSEATLEVLEHQIATAEPIAASEHLVVIPVDGGAEPIARELAARVRAASLMQVNMPQKSAVHDEHDCDSAELT